MIRVNRLRVVWRLERDENRREHAYMKTVMVVPLLISAASLAQPQQVELDSPPVQGPHGLSGWIVSEAIPGLESQGPLPITLVLARNGHVFRRLSYGTLLWKWSFQNDGKWVAFEMGPLHFSLACVLSDTATGRQLASQDCYNKDLLAPSNPAWVRQLEANGNAWIPTSLHTQAR